MNKLKFIIHSLLVILSVSSAVKVFVTLNGSGAEYLFILPLTFLFIYPLLYRLLKFDSGPIITTFVVIIFSFLRLVIIPLVTVLVDINSFIHSSQILLMNQAILLIVYEHIAICIFLFILFQGKTNTNRIVIIKQRGNTYAYIVFLFLVLIVYILYGRGLELFDFIVKSVDDFERGGDLLDGKSVIIRQVMSSGLLFLFIIGIEKFRKKYYDSKNKIYIYLAIFAALLMVSIIVGERRTNQINVGFAAAWTLIRIFPAEKKKIGTSVFAGAIFVLMMMTIYKHFNAYLYGSYIVAMQSSSIAQTITANTLDAYFFGIRTVMKNLEFAQTAKVDISNFIFDIYRNFFGVNYIVKGEGLTTSELYNQFIYSGTQLTGLLYSSIGYGATYFGLLLAPIVSCINLFFCVMLERILKKSKSIEMNYIIALIFMRVLFGLFGNPAQLINFSTRFIIVNGIIFLFARYLFRFKKTI